MLLERVKNIMEQYGKYDEALAKKFSYTNQLKALEVVLKNGHNPEDALKFDKDQYNEKSLQYKALKEFGITVDEALEIKTQKGYEALTILGKDKAAIAAKFQYPSQIKALKVLVLRDEHNPEDALKFDKDQYNEESLQYKALKEFGVTVDEALEIKIQKGYEALTILGKDKAAIAAKFQYPSQIKALKVILKNGHNPEDALKFDKDQYNEESLQYKALKEFGVTVDEALEIKSNEGYQALTILGKEKAVIAAKFSHPNQIKALVLLKNINPEMALKFEYLNQIKALKVVLENKHNPEEALKFDKDQYNDESPQFKALQFGVTADEALNIKYDDGYRALTILGKEKADIAAKFSSSSQIMALNNLGLDPSDALKISLPAQYNALKYLGKDRIEDAIKFERTSQLEAMEQHGLNIEDALKFIYGTQVTALELTHDLTNSLLIDNHIKLKCLKAPGANIAEVVRCDNNLQAEVYTYVKKVNYPDIEKVFSITSGTQYNELVEHLKQWVDSHQEL